MKKHLDSAKDKMIAAIAQYERHLSTIRTGRASTSILADIHVDYYGEATPLTQIGSVSVLEGKQLVVKPFDTHFLKQIEKAIFEANIGYTPQNDGSVIRINIPPLSEQTRKELVKLTNKHAEECKVVLRNIRRDINDGIKKDDELSEDAEKDALEKMQKLTDDYIKKVDVITEAKNKDIMTV
jgi:ribosome recycling factor